MQRRRGGPEDWARVIGCFFAAAMIGAPFVALIYSRAAGLAVAAAAPGATAYLVLQAAPNVEPARRRTMMLIAIGNGVLAVVCLISVVWLVV